MKVLLVEDETMVRDLLALEVGKVCKDWEIIEASNGQHALETFNRHDGKIDLIITDKNMPIMEGDELVRRIRQLKHDQKIIMLTGSRKTDEIRQLRVLFFSKREFDKFPAFLKMLIDDFDDPVLWS